MLNTIYSKVIHKKRNPSPLLNGKTVHYHGNGSGRDSYIMLIK